MKLLLDTNVLSEVTKRQPDARVLRFLHETDEDRMHVSAVTLAEIRRGIALMAEGRQRSVLLEWLSRDLVERFAGRILPVESVVAAAWGDLMAAARKQGIALHVMDGFIAATAQAMGMIVVTRNGKDFRPLGIPVLNPWSEAAPDPAASPG